MCKNFLWIGKVHTNKPSLIAWDLVCRAKKEGGLGVVDCARWNDAAVAKYICHIASKVDMLWVKWVNHIYIKDKGWWQYEAPADSCWYWKQICGLKQKFAAGYIQGGWLKPQGKYTVQSGYY